MGEARKLHDRFFKQAKADGYAARSAYKLKEIQDRRSVLRRGDWVVDLGCSPGSWVQVAAEIVGPKGRVVGIDLKPVAIAVPANARTIVGDIFKVSAGELLALAGDDGRPGPGAFQSVLSDMAPSTEGGAGGTVDHFRSIELCRRVLELVPSLLARGGSCVMKVFEGEAYPDLLRETGRMFAEVKGLKPEASRDVSREMFVVATGYRGGGPAGTGGGTESAPARPAPRPGWGS
jgi:23S rRNA (uridine2552-2'-O)-methyltransferase